MISLDRLTHLTFDCYGTLIDWESGILGAIRPVLERHGVRAADAEILRLHAQHEAEEEAGAFKPYRCVLRDVMSRIASALGFRPEPGDLEVLAGSIGRWDPFPDTCEALRKLKARYRLVIISNVDDAMFAETAKRLSVPFDAIVTAEQVGAYKPSGRPFRFALRRLGVPKCEILHVAQSLYHDHVPAKALGLKTAWVTRAGVRRALGASAPTGAAPDLEVADLRGLVEAMGL